MKVVGEELQELQEFRSYRMRQHRAAFGAKPISGDF
jgi:hypothetical protein